MDKSTKLAHNHQKFDKNIASQADVIIVLCQKETSTEHAHLLKIICGKMEEDQMFLENLDEFINDDEKLVMAYKSL